MYYSLHTVRRNVMHSQKYPVNKIICKMTGVFVCLQDMSYQHKDLLQMQPAAVSSSCLASLQQPTGILLLEEGLVQDCSPEEPPAKRARGGRKEVPPDTEKWIHLAKYVTVV